MKYEARLPFLRTWACFCMIVLMFITMRVYNGHFKNPWFNGRGISLEQRSHKINHWNIASSTDRQALWNPSFISLYKFRSDCYKIQWWIRAKGESFFHAKRDNLYPFCTKVWTVCSVVDVAVMGFSSLDMLVELFGKSPALLKLFLWVKNLTSNLYFFR